MTDEERVKAKYSRAISHRGTMGWEIYTANGRLLSYGHKTESEAWADAAARIEASHE